MLKNFRSLILGSRSLAAMAVAPLCHGAEPDSNYYATAIAGWASQSDQAA